jgi:hypothetical protein
MSREVEELEDIIDLFTQGYLMDATSRHTEREQVFMEAYTKLLALDKKPDPSKYRFEFNKDMWTRVTPFSHRASAKEVREILKDVKEICGLYRVYFSDKSGDDTFVVFPKTTIVPYYRIELSDYEDHFVIQRAWEHGREIENPNDYYENNSYSSFTNHDIYGRHVNVVSEVDYSYIFKEDLKTDFDFKMELTNKILLKI